MRRDLTMTLFTYNRSHMLSEIIQYHAPTGIQLHILDASDSAFAIEKLLDLHKNVSYHHLPGTTQLERLHFILPQVTTPFFVFRADRRHVTNRSLYFSTDFLKKNDDYASATGLWLTEPYLHPYHQSELVTKNGELEDPYARTENQILSYQPSYYNVHRTDNIRRLAKIYTDITTKTANIYYHEYVQAMTNSLCGKTKQLTCLGGIVQSMDKEVDYSEAWPKTMDLAEDTELSHFLAETLYAHLQDKGFDYHELRESVLRSTQNISLRFLLYRINIAEIRKKEKNTYKYMEKVFSILNQHEIDTSKYTEKALRVLACIAFENDIAYRDLKYLFSNGDIAEQDALKTIIENCKKQKMIAEIRATKENIRQRNHS